MHFILDMFLYVTVQAFYLLHFLLYCVFVWLIVLNEPNRILFIANYVRIFCFIYVFEISISGI